MGDWVAGDGVPQGSHGVHMGSLLKKATGVPAEH